MMYILKKKSIRQDTAVTRTPKKLLSRDKEWKRVIVQGCPKCSKSNTKIYVTTDRGYSRGYRTIPDIRS